MFNMGIKFNKPLHTTNHNSYLMLSSNILPPTTALSSTLATPLTPHCIASGLSASSSTSCFNSINHVTLFAIKNQFPALPTTTPSTTLTTLAIIPSANHQALSYTFSSNLSTNIAEVFVSPYAHISKSENVLIDMR